MTKNYKLAGEGKDRPFVISGGLQEGYGDSGKLHDLSEVVTAHHAWQAEAGKIVGCYVQSTTLSYGWPQDGVIHSASEPGWILGGAINPIYDKDVPDTEVWEQLTSLATFVAGRLGQTRVYVSFGGVTKIFQAAESATPTGN